MPWGRSWTGDTGWYSGTGSRGLEDVPALSPISIGGHEYVIDVDKYKRATIPALRPAMDQAPEPGEVSLNNAGLWRRSQSDWRLGAQQLMFDEQDSKRQRYWASKGLNPHPDTPADAYQMRMHKDVQQSRASSFTNLELLVCGPRLYMVDGDELWWTTTLDGGVTSWTAAGMSAATGGQSILDVCFDGANIYAAVGAGGLYFTVSGSSSAANFLIASHTVNGCAYANGNLFAFQGPWIYQVNAGGEFDGDGGPPATGLLAFEHPNPAFVWQEALSTPHGVFMSGNSGISGEMLLITVDPTTSALTSPASMFILPDGEGLNEMCYYSGAIIIGTTLGVRVAQVQIVYVISCTYGPVILIPGGATSVFGYGQWGWFGWSNYDNISTGLGRLDLARFANDLTPAVSSDIMVTAQGVVTSVVNFNGTICFTVSGAGLWNEHPTNYVTSGMFDAGRIKFGTTENKLPLYIDLYHDPLPLGASVSVAVTDEFGVSHQGGVSNVPDTIHPEPVLVLNDSSPSEQISLQFTITNGVDPTDPPILRRWTLYALVVPRRVDRIDVPIILNRAVKEPAGDGGDQYYDTLAEWQFLKGLEASGSPVLYEEGDLSQLVYVDTVEMDATQWDPIDHHWLEGLCTVSLVTLEVGS